MRCSRGETVPCGVQTDVVKTTKGAGGREATGGGEGRVGAAEQGGVHVHPSARTQHTHAVHARSTCTQMQMQAALQSEEEVGGDSRAGRPSTAQPHPP